MRRMKRERGAVAVMVAILMVVLIGFTAIAVDGGALWMDRKELQNGADASALALAQSCAKGAACPATVMNEGDATPEMAMAEQYAQGNKRDANVTVTKITYTGSTVTVEVATTRTHWFAPVIGVDSSDISASATATIGGIGAAVVAPFTVSYCHLAQITAGATGVRLTLKGESNDCQPGNPPYALPGGFNWLDVDASSSDCSVATSISTDDKTTWAPGDSGNDGVDKKITACDTLLKNLLGQTIVIPVFDKVDGRGSNGLYKIYGYAAYAVDAYCLNQGQGWEGNTNKTDRKCDGSDRWLIGTFVDWVDPSATGGGPDLNVTTYYLIA